MPYPRSVNISEILDFSPVGRLQIEVLCLCILVTFIDGFDVQAIAYSAPAIIHNWHITRSAFTPALVAGVTGTVAGTLLLGPLADYVGRKWIIIGCTAFVSLCSFATMAAHSIEAITILRFVTGLGIGGAYPNAIALTSEYSSRKHQTLMVVIAVCGNSLGGVIGGTLAARLIPEFGWPSVFMFGGLLPLILIPVLVWKLCESVRFLIIKQRDPGQVIKILKRMKLDSQIQEGARFVLTEESRSGVSLKHLFTDGRARMTLLIWTMWFMNLTGMFFISSWLPTVANGAGLSISRSVMAGSLLHAGGIIGCLCFGLTVRRMNSTTALGIFYLLGTFCIVALGAVTAAPNLVLIVAFAAGFCVIGSQNSSNAVTARLYSTFIGATGISWAFGIGRMGSIAGPLIGGGLLSLNLSTQNLFLIAAIPGLIAAIAAFTLAASTFGNYRVSPVEQQAVGVAAPDSK